MSNVTYCGSCGQPNPNPGTPCQRCGQMSAGQPAQPVFPQPPQPGFPPYGAPFTGGTSPENAFQLGNNKSVNVTTSSFFKSLFDHSFDTLVTPKLIRIFWIITLILWGLSGLLSFIFYVRLGTIGVIIAIVVLPIFLLFQLIIMRVTFEVIAGFFRLVEDLRAIRDSRGL